MGNVFDIKDIEWKLTRPDSSKEVYAKGLITTDLLKLSLVTVKPGGHFRPHIDKHGHIFYFICGEGNLIINDITYAISPGTVAIIDAGDEHSYCNTGSKELKLVSGNLFE